MCVICYLLVTYNFQGRTKAWSKCFLLPAIFTLKHWKKIFLTVSCLIKLAFHLQSDLVAIQELKVFF